MRLGNERGFTLVELLVSLAITAAAAGLLASALWSGREAWARAERGVEGGEGVAAAQAVLRERIGHLLSDATGSADLGAAAMGAPDVVGTATALSFVARAPMDRQPAPPERVVVELDRAGRLDLVTVDARFLAGRGRPKRVPVIDGVAAVRFGYYGAPLVGGGERWWSDWPGNADPPRLVRLRLRFVPGDRRHWPDLVVRPGAGVAATCRIGPDGNGCVAA